MGSTTFERLARRGAPRCWREIAADNRADRWPELREGHAALVRGPTLALAAELAAEFGPVRVFRPHVDAAVPARRAAVAHRHRRRGDVAGRLRDGGRAVGRRAHGHGRALAVRPRAAAPLPGGGRRRGVGRGAGRAAAAARRGRAPGRSRG